MPLPDDRRTRTRLPPTWLTVPAIPNPLEYRDLQYAPCVFLEAGSGLEQTTPSRNRHGMRPVIRPELLNQILNMKVDRALRDRQSIGNLFISVSVPDQLQNLRFPRR